MTLPRIEQLEGHDHDDPEFVEYLHIALKNHYYESCPFCGMELWNPSMGWD